MRRKKNIGIGLTRITLKTQVSSNGVLRLYDTLLLYTGLNADNFRDVCFSLQSAK